MGKPSSPSPRPYQDDPDALSMHTTEGEPSYVDPADEDIPDTGDPLLPSYNDAITTDTRANTGSHYTQAAVLNFEGEFFTGVTTPEGHFAYTSKRIGKKRTTIGNEVVDVQDERSDADPGFLEEWVTMMSRYPPSPYIHIIGTHQETRRDKDGKSKREEVTDFRIMINMQNYLWPNFVPGVFTHTKLETAEPGQKTYRGTVLKKRQKGSKGDIEVGQHKPSLKEWCHRYCAKATGTKIFRLTRNVSGMDEEMLRDSISGYIRSTNYRGNISVEFPVADRAVDIYSTSYLNKWRLTRWICWLFYLTFLWVFAWPVLFFATKRHEVVKVTWPFAKCHPDGQRSFTSVSESQWLDMYGPAIKQLCLDRYQGLAGDAFLNEVLAREPSPVNTGLDPRAAMSAASAAFQGGQFTAANGARSLMRLAGVATDQVGWGFDT
ncbi:hypothetical protein FSPOR_4726 [Fusarium sporotrichioides]|uniref:Abc transporter n=1 Tax=Fusarium sporotrichioides TaxID=5514 RepID=A0A395SB35_FUSSP|nr:hypothetical protein FSPOR_4726 [Fusarium sporotrichioides]